MKKNISIITIVSCIFILCLIGISLIYLPSYSYAFSVQDTGHIDHDEHAEEHEDHGNLNEHAKDHGDHSDYDSSEDEHEDHEGHEHEEGLQFNSETLEEFQITTEIAKPGIISKFVDTSGEIVPNPDLVSHIVPRVPGVVREVKFSLGDSVKEGEILAILESRELASLKSNYLSAIERLKLSQEIFEREKQLWEKKISAEQEFLEAKQKLAENKINVNAAEQQLHAVGFSQEYVDKLPQQPDALITRYEIRAPFSGQITEKHITLGEYVKDEDSIFTISDLSQVWVNLTLYQKNLPSIQTGQEVAIHFQLSEQQIAGKISLISPMLDLHTRTGTARVVIDNTDGIWRPGMFVNASIAAEKHSVTVCIPNSAIMNINNHPTVFVQTENGFEPKTVSIGRNNSYISEITSGLTDGDVYVSNGGFSLKAELDKEAFAHAGHAH